MKHGKTGLGLLILSMTLVACDGSGNFLADLDLRSDADVTAYRNQAGEHALSTALLEGEYRTTGPDETQTFRSVPSADCSRTALETLGMLDSGDSEEVFQDILSNGKPFEVTNWSLDFFPGKVAANVCLDLAYADDVEWPCAPIAKDGHVDILIGQNIFSENIIIAGLISGRFVQSSQDTGDVSAFTFVWESYKAQYQEAATGEVCTISTIVDQDMNRVSKTRD